MTSDCFSQSVKTMQATRSLATSFYSYNYDDFLAPIYKFADFGIEITNVTYNCQTINFAKQLAIRTTSWGGFIELCMTIIMAFVRNAVEPGGSTLYNAFDAAFVSSNSCARTSRAWGEILSLIFSVETPTEIFVEDLTFKLE